MPPAKKTAAAKKPAAPKKTAAARKASAKKGTPSADQIATRAYFIYEQERGGDPLDHWLRAERELAVS